MFKGINSVEPEKSDTEQKIDLSVSLGFRSAFLFPLQSKVARREVAIGAIWLLVPFVGWILNMGHRIMMTHRMQNGLSAWPAWRDYPSLLKHGTITFLGMVEYHSPAVLCCAIAYAYEVSWLYPISAILWIIATIAVPGYMSHYCLAFDYREIFDPFKALRRVFQGGTAYWHAWSIAFAALLISFAGLIAFGIGFLFTSVWFWQVAGFCFARVFTNKYELKGSSQIYE
ncbi:hypothetical protein QEH56_22490 [Pelagicoccus enzymogenes]|uniref:hypothetical protein n=1 Tax=Pelagicoccus enzymogenes TaxID=2773457 RepID=UPI00280E5123|nr:hypothetical protein [Pelagicoccus enzymogenes]MDQ8200953.1 hypothetical protein [Pelagicoccus enzymogenes]